ncbi:hypothetical protein L0222_09055 [bacterium]|nr:hypothetical protein [bacterium]MCI0607344.1 hypothetical protein [bacterium]
MRYKEFLFCAGIVLLTILAGADKGKGSAVRAAARENTNGQDALLLVVKATQSVLLGETQSSATASAVLDLQGTTEMRVKLDEKEAEDATAVIVPEGWTARKEKSEIILTGRPIDNESNAYVRLNFSKAKCPKDAKVTVSRGNQKIFEDKIEVFRLPRVIVRTVLEDVLTLSPKVSPGEELTFQPLDLTQTPVDGNWMISGTPCRRIESLRYSVRLPETLKAGDSMSVQYTDPWGEKLIDVSAAPDTRVVDLPEEGKPRIVNCTPRAFIENSLCVCGWFPGNTYTGILLDGQPVNPFTSTSSQVVHLVVPAAMQPGRHLLTGNSAMGFTAADRAEFLVLGVVGEIDQDKLWKGQSTPMRLWVRGTEEPVELRITNHTPSIIQLEGGDKQLIMTSGGADNKIVRSVKGIHRGNFEVTYELAAEPCPCAE